MTKELAEIDAALVHILDRSPVVDDSICFEDLKQPLQAPAPERREVASSPTPPPRYDAPEPPKRLQRLKPGAVRAFEESVLHAQSEYAREMRLYWERNEWRQTRLERESGEGASATRKRVARAPRQHAEVDEFHAAVKAGDPTAVVDYLGLVLQCSRYPEGFTRAYRMVFEPGAKRLLVDYELPPLEAIPAVDAYVYNASDDRIVPSPRSAETRARLYADVVTQTTLRSICELFESDKGCLIDTIVFNGLVGWTLTLCERDPERACLISVSVGRELFDQVNLRANARDASLEMTGARVSADPANGACVEPLMRLADVQDTRFHNESQKPRSPNKRPNLMSLSAEAFETLISELLEKMNLEIETTSVSQRGDVDCVALDPRPVLGGKVLIQALRSVKTIGIREVRELFATMQVEGASKAIVLSTSGYSRSALNFAKAAPVELLDQEALLKLLRNHVGIEAEVNHGDEFAVIDPVGVKVIDSVRRS